jgi:drug/metabolite transporter (DMT)-like permease
MLATHSSFRPRDAALLLVLAVVWGNSFFFIKTAVAVVPPLWIVTTRMALGATLLVLIGLTQKGRPSRAREAELRAPPLDLGTFVKVGMVGIFGSALPWAGQAWAQRFLESGLMSVLNATTPVATLLLALMLRQERLYTNRLLGLGLALLGTGLVIGIEVRAGRSALAQLVGVLATFGYAFAAVMTRAYVSGRMSNVWAAATQLSWGTLVLAPIAWAFHGPPPTELSAGVLGALGALGLLGTGAAFLIYFALLERVGATNTSMVTYLVPQVA